MGGLCISPKAEEAVAVMKEARMTTCLELQTSSATSCMQRYGSTTLLASAALSEAFIVLVLEAASALFGSTAAPQQRG